MVELESPIILVGMIRSGTTWLGNALSQASDVAYWSEPRQVWCYGNYFQPDDVLTEKHASDEVQRYIHRRFLRYTRDQRAERFCEKTPSNCLRVRFLHKVFPKAQFIFLIRDGRAVFRSTKEMQKTIITWKRIRARMTESSIWELPAYFRTLPGLWSKLRRRPIQYFGVRPPGWQEWQKHMTPNQITARQWADTLEIMWRDMPTIPAEQKIVLKYEDMTEDPVGHTERLVDFLRIKDKQSVIRFIRETAKPTRATAWTQELSPQCLDEIRPITEPTLLKLGYVW